VTVAAETNLAPGKTAAPFSTLRFAATNDALSAPPLVESQRPKEAVNVAFRQAATSGLAGSSSGGRRAMSSR
jgi:hypothetical protein